MHGKVVKDYRQKLQTRRMEAMMDVLMIAILLGCFGLVKAFADFCDWQIKPKEKQEDIKMIVLGILVLLLAGYLVYALIHPEKL